MRGYLGQISACLSCGGAVDARQEVLCLLLLVGAVVEIARDGVRGRGGVDGSGSNITMLLRILFRVGSRKV
jgi:hypothetical protein